MEMVRKENGDITRYQMIGRYNVNYVSYYASTRKGNSTPLLFPSIVRCMPPGSDIPSFLDRLEERAEKIPVDAKEEKRGYDYSGIPMEVAILTLMMIEATGMATSPGSSYFRKVLSKGCFTPFLSTLSRIASLWGMTMKGFVKAYEKEDLSFIPEACMANGDNSKQTIVRRIMELTGCERRCEFLSLYPEHSRNAIGKHIASDEDFLVSTLLFMLRPLDMKLSEVLEETILI